MGRVVNRIPWHMVVVEWNILLDSGFEGSALAR
jgi:hypothetical protein